MPTKPTPVVPQHKDWKIKVEHLSNLITYYNEIWTGGTYSFDANHSTGTDDRKFGWGQVLSAISPLPATGSLATVSDTNQCIAQVNAGLYHTEDDPTPSATVEGLYPELPEVRKDVGDLIPASVINEVCDKIESLESKKFQVDWTDAKLSEQISTNTTPWNLDLAVVHKFTFANYNEARHFFNSGGELAFELSMDPGGPVSNMVWQQIFEQFDWIRIGADRIRVITDADNNPAETQYDVMTTNTITPKGFYGIDQTSSDYTTILDAGVFRYKSGSEYAYAYVYVYSEYNSRRIRIQLKADEVGGTFNIYARVILIEDADDTYSITQPITLTSGYIQPTTPNALGNAPYMTDVHGLNQFIERIAPTVTEHTPWTEDEYGAGEQLDWASTDPGTNWSHTGSGSLFTNE